jgi:hypothetical protein
MVSEAISKGDVAALNYFIADKYIKAFGQLADSPNQKVIMLPIEAMSILGSLAGIGEIARATVRRERGVGNRCRAPRRLGAKHGRDLRRRRRSAKVLEVVSWLRCSPLLAPGTG